ncbi:MAG: hypothetical protein AAGF55_07490 [Pseudomonadota bacterium]
MTTALARFFSGVTIALLIALIIGSVRPGPHRAMSPTSFGLTKIAPNIWTDAPEKAEQLRDLVRASRTNVANYFGDTPPESRVILCATKTCARDFGVRGNGLSVPRFAVLVSPGGLTLGTLTHEFTHARLHRRLGPRNLVRQPFPTWFDEGLATHVAQHPLVPGAPSQQARDRVRKVEHVWQWDDAYRSLGVGVAYTAAATEVAEIEAILGKQAFLRFIEDIEAGSDFDAALDAVRIRQN